MVIDDLIEKFEEYQKASKALCAAKNDCNYDWSYYDAAAAKDEAKLELERSLKTVIHDVVMEMKFFGELGD